MADFDLQAWRDYQDQQKFEHQLIDRKTVWLLTTQGLLFAAYGVATTAEVASCATTQLMDSLPLLGMLLSILTFVGVLAVINSKRMSWVDYCAHYGESRPRFVPSQARTEFSWRRHKEDRLPWGVRTVNTVISLVPDLLYPVVFFVAWVMIAT